MLERRDAAEAWQRWSVADLALPSPRPALRRALWPVLVAASAATAFLYAGLASRAYPASSEFSVTESLTVDVVLCAVGALVALYGCRQQLLSAPATLLLPTTAHAVVSAAAALAFTRLDLAPLLGERWMMALFIVELVSLPIATRLWGLFTMAVERGRLGVAWHAATLVGYHLALVGVARGVAPLISLHISDLA
jgi:hypothetical protein